MTITPVSTIPVSIDYTGKDYYSLRNELVARIQDRIPNWTGTDPHDFGVALVEAFAYLGDVMSYYIDRAANEAFIDTATQRSSVINIASTYGYVVSGYSASFITVTFTNTSTSDVTVPAGTIISGDIITGDVVNTVEFTTEGDCVVYPADPDTLVPGQGTVNASHGRSVIQVSGNANANGELLGTSSGLPNMYFQLGETPVVSGSIEIYVQEGDVFSKWKQVQHLLDYNPSDLVFTVYTEEDDTVYINFGDGVSGAIPTLYSEIRAKYTVGGGVVGNVPLNSITTIEYIPGLTESQTTSLQSYLSVTNSSEGLGGVEPDSIDVIRTSAPLALRANNRAVTRQDYADLSLRAAVTGSSVAKANATGTWPSVTLYIAPARSATDTDVAPGLDGTGVTMNGSPTIEFTTLASDVTSFLSDKIMMGTTVSIQPPTYVDAIIAIQYTKLDQYSEAEVELGIKTKLLTEFGYNNMYFQQTITPQNIEYQLSRVPGVQSPKITALHRTGGSGVLTLVGGAGEIFRFTETNTSVGAA